jgi:hypothetical protein
VSWQVHGALTRYPTRYGALLSSVSCVARSLCIGVGNHGYRITAAQRWNGTGWSGMHPLSPSRTSNQLYSISCLSRSWCIAVGVYGRHVASAGTVNTPLAESYS